MGIIQIIGLILGVLRFLPDIIKLIHSILELLKSLEGRPGFDKKLILSELKDAIHEVKENKDTRKLEELHRKLNTWCVGDKCPSGVPLT